MTNVNKRHSPRGDIVSILTHRYLPIRKFFYFLIVQTIFSQYSAHANTIIAVARTDSFVIVAADSRTVDTAGKQDDRHTCKITRLDDSSFFAASGAIPFDVKDQARIHYTSTIPLTDNAEIWANTAESIYYNQPNGWKEELAAGINNIEGGTDTVTYGIFGRLSAEHTDVVVVRIRYRRNPLTMVFYHRPPDEIQINKIVTWGSTNTSLFLNELLRGGTESAAQWELNVHQQAAVLGYGEMDAYVLRFKSAIETAINARTDPGIGGEVAVLVLERQKPARWFSQTSACKN
jgi:hypothetical protein